MKNLKAKWWLGFLTLLLVLAAAGSMVAANGGMTIDWYSVDGGGGQSAGADYQLDGTIGQPDANSAATGGSYRLDGGYLTASATPTDYSVYLPVVLRP